MHSTSIPENISTFSARRSINVSLRQTRNQSIMTKTFKNYFTSSCRETGHLFPKWILSRTLTRFQNFLFLVCRELGDPCPVSMLPKVGEIVQSLDRAS